MSSTLPTDHVLSKNCDPQLGPVSREYGAPSVSGTYHHLRLYTRVDREDHLEVVPLLRWYLVVTLQKKDVLPSQSLPQGIASRYNCSLAHPHELDFIVGFVGGAQFEKILYPTQDALLLVQLLLGDCPHLVFVFVIACIGGCAAVAQLWRFCEIQCVQEEQ